MSVIETHNPDFELAVKYVCQTGKAIFLTGKAGTGKTTFLRYIREQCPKKMAVVAPTGVAAINAGGVTMHSFFQLPFGAYIADHKTEWGGGNMEINNTHTLLKNLRLNHNKRQLIQELELLVIDEVSMLRADMLDAIDTVLRHTRSKYDEAFGGVQVLFIGDLYQLPPVVNREEWQLMSATYSSPFFFDARVLKETELVCIELRKIYRQRDTTFINVLNNIRNNNAGAQDLAVLEKHYNPDFSPAADSGYIILTSHNSRADVVNKTELEKLPSKLHYFDAVIKGDFGDKISPVEKAMPLKEGAQVMFIKNDKGENRRFYNGKIVRISRIDFGKVFVMLDDDIEMELEKETWRNVNYQYNKDRDEIEEEEIGSFTQYPIRLAWAITIHKSQGLTFEKAIVDAGSSFAAGQVYVALSRLTSLDGLILHTRINPGQVMTDERVVRYSNQVRTQDSLARQLGEEQRSFAAQKLLGSFDLDKLCEAYKDNYLGFSKSAIPDKADAVISALKWSDAINRQQTVAQKFNSQLKTIFQPGQQADYHHLEERTVAAGTYFLKELKELETALDQHINEYKVKQKTKKYIAQLRYILLLLQRKVTQIDQAVRLAKGLNTGTDIAALLNTIEQDKKQLHAAEEEAEQKESKTKKEVGASKNITFDLYKEGRTIEEIAQVRSMAASTIEGHLTSFIATGELEVSTFVDSAELSLILKKIKELNNISNTSILKENLPADISYTKLRAVLAYHDRISKEG
ncbi:MAG TPA: helix-turn-helix domain-containing protein [Chitinophagaceae bacterium]|nr:helix-turn-helix domain-containing protein [Chitinophagaceae bacterium]